MKLYLAFYIPYILFVVIFTTLILINEQADLHLWFTSYHTPTADVFFRYYTYVGGSFPYLVIAGLTFYSYRVAFFILLAQLLAGLFAIIIKQTWDEPRPVAYFKDNFPNVELHRVAGEHLLSIHSFPSGHTTSAFTLFLALTFLTKRPSLHFLYFLLALLVGFSRIYLSQHFALDVLVGSVIGVTVTIMFRHFFDKSSFLRAEGSFRDVFNKKESQ